MDIAALITWVLTALGGFYMLGTWISKGGHRQPSSSHLPPAVIFSHFGLAALGLVLWIVYLFTDSDALKWIAFVILLPVAVLGFVMLLRWIPTYRGTRAGAGTGAAAGTAVDANAPAESHFPVPVVVGHGALAVITLVLVLLTALGVGTS
jgi:manganese efflux pump family protein